MQDADSIAASRRPPYLRFLSLGISGILIVGGAFVMYRWLSGPEILNMLRRIDWRWLILAIFTYWLQYPISAIRMNRVMHWLMQPKSPAPPSFRLILKVTLSSGFISVTAPVGLMADVAKIGALKYFGQMSTSHAIQCTLFDRVIAAQWMSLFALATLPLQWALGVPTSSIGIQFLVSAAFLVAIIVLLFLPNVLRIFDHVIVLKFAKIFSGYEMMFPLRRSAVQMVITAANLALVFATLYCLLRAVGLTANLAVIACFVPFLQVVNGVPFLYMGWGGREIAMAATVGVASGLSINQALVVSAIWGLTLILAGAVNGVFVLGDWHSHRTTAAPPPSGTPPVV
jgi:uncharacterized membrane protein YbhN (UPF0104 family)